MGPLIGQSIGANHIAKAKRYGLIGWVTGVTFGVLCSIVILVIPRKVFSIYTNKGPVLDIMENAAPFICACIILDHSQICLSGIIVGLGKQRQVSRYIVLLYYTIGIPVGCLCTFVFKLHDGGFWIGLACAFVSVNLLYLIVYKRTNFEEISAKVTSRQMLEEVDEIAEVSSESGSSVRFAEQIDEREMQRRRLIQTITSQSESASSMGTVTKLDH